MAGGPESEGHPQLGGELETSLGYSRLSKKEKRSKRFVYSVICFYFIANNSEPLLGPGDSAMTQSQSQPSKEFTVGWGRKKTDNSLLMTAM